jgi:hypothetical protein
LYTPLSIATSVTGGLLASALFGMIWKRLSDEQPAPPNPKDLSRSSTAVLLGAGLQGLVFGVVKAAVDRAGARGYNAITDDDPAAAACKSTSVKSRYGLSRSGGRCCGTAKQSAARGKTLEDLVDNEFAEDLTDVAVRRKSI